MKSRHVLLVALFCSFGFYCATRPDFSLLAKVDSHVHIDTYDGASAEQARADGFRLLTIVVGSTDSLKLNKERAWAIAQHRQQPRTVFWLTTFSLQGFEEPGWQQKTISRLAQDFSDGAIGVKVWKDIGMVIRDRSGRFVMIDDPRLDGVFSFISGQQKPVVAHLGEPRNCWLPLEQMTVNSDRNYFSRHPEYHMFLHPDFPSYEAQIACRDQWLAKNPALHVIGAHLGSLEYDVAELAKRLDRYPNFSVDMSARICHFQVQNRETVRDFIITYQDRLLYGTDIGVDEGEDSAAVKSKLHNVWLADWAYLSTAAELTSSRVNGSFQGLKLPVTVLKKIYETNAETWLAFKR